LYRVGSTRTLANKWLTGFSVSDRGASRLANDRPVPSGQRGIQGTVGSIPSAGHSAPAGHENRPAEGYLGWLPNWYTPGFIGYRHNQWYAVSTEFCVIGMGQSPQEAHADLIVLLDSYLRSFHEHGQPFSAAQRPIGTLAKLRLLLSLKRRKRLLLSAPLPH
jgi:hypothetical protein